MEKKIMFLKKGLFLLILLWTSSVAYAATTILYDQNFENPNGFNNDAGDVDQNTVNNLYGNQPIGFSFVQTYTVETLLVTGNQAFGTGYSDPQGKAGNYSLGMLEKVQNDLLGLSFNLEDNDYLNLRLDISSIDLSVFGGPFINVNNNIPKFKFTLLDDPTVSKQFNSGTILYEQTISGTVSNPSVFDWTEVELALDATGNTNGNVMLQIDLVEGGYAALDNFLIVSSENPNDFGDTPTVPEPATMLLLSIGLITIGLRKHKFQK